MLTSPPPVGPSGNSRGFSLVELLVTVTILALLMVAAMPSMGAWLRNTAIRNAAESLSNGLNKARNEAVRRNQTVLFSLVTSANGNPGLLDTSCALSTTSASWIVSLASPANQCNADVSDTAAPQILAKFAQGDGAANVTVTVKNDNCAATDTTTQVSFSNFGRVNNAAPLRCIEVRHTLSADTHPLQVRINPGGSVRVCDPVVTNLNDPRRC
jgi:type IV fimbrial biogenesis protein FimT